jgi:hypothetical protein
VATVAAISIAGFAALLRTLSVIRWRRVQWQRH